METVAKQGKTSSPIRLLSGPMVHTPGILVWIQSLYKSDPVKAIEALAGGWASMPVGVAVGIAKGDITWTVDKDEAAVLNLTDEQRALFPAEVTRERGVRFEHNPDASEQDRLHEAQAAIGLALEIVEGLVSENEDDDRWEGLREAAIDLENVEGTVAGLADEDEDEEEDAADQALADRIREAGRARMVELVESTGTAAYDDESDQELIECIISSIKAGDIDASSI